MKERKMKENVTTNELNLVDDGSSKITIKSKKKKNSVETTN